MQHVLSIFILLAGAAFAWFYLRKPPAPQSDNPTIAALLADRPWRRIGAAICLLLSVMFVVGLYAVDVPASPKAYAAFWLIIMVLVLWLCVLAIKDVLHTRRIVNEGRAARERGTQSRLGVESTDDSGKESSDVSRGARP